MFVFTTRTVRFGVTACGVRTFFFWAGFFVMYSSWVLRSSSLRSTARPACACTEVGLHDENRPLRRDRLRCGNVFLLGWLLRHAFLWVFETSSALNSRAPWPPRE